MKVFSEILSVRQIAGEPRRRWFMCDAMELILWVDEMGGPAGFQLSYDKGGIERALTWHADRGYSHRRVDPGEGSGTSFKATPVLGASYWFKPRAVLAMFESAASGLPPEVADFVGRKLREHPDVGQPVRRPTCGASQA
ncbi:MAG: hypothetical protein IT577_04275 [Verrucomicrobiae bacterium]|nr:hypothetical protein [Verrucomicrobiae bacterium]